MPIYKHKHTGKRFLFVHIPRTAGRFLTENFKSNGFELEDSFIWESVDGIEPAHFHRELYQKYLNADGIEHISIVRNPVDRFISTSIFLTRMYGDDIQEAMEDPMMFSSMIQNFPLSEGVNWFRPQMDFISDETRLWKLEDGFGEDFEQWLGEVLEMEIEIKKVPYKKLTTDEDNKLKKSAKLIDNITLLYKRDYEHLYPELATPQQEGGQTKT